VNLLFSASGSQPQGNTKNDRIQRAPSKAKQNKLEDHHRTIRPGKMFTTVGHIWRPTGRTFTLVGNVCPLTRISTTAIVPLREPIPIESNKDKPVVTLVYSRKSKAAKKKVPVVQIVLWYLDSGCSKHMTRDRSQLINFVQKFLGTVKFGNDHVAKIMGYGDYKIGNVTISRVYFVEGLGHNLFLVIGISHETSVARSPQQNGVVEGRNRSLIEAAHTMLIYAKLRYFYGQRMWQPLVLPKIDPSYDFDMERHHMSFFIINYLTYHIFMCLVLYDIRLMIVRTWGSYNRKMISGSSLAMHRQRKIFGFTTGVQEELLKQSM
nr:integrase, catalytic region, zinc finger, CCHC-type, peptidase aspartic, catalytic [Tanacetum cinerariifolium]